MTGPEEREMARMRAFILLGKERANSAAMGLETAFRRGQTEQLLQAATSLRRHRWLHLFRRRHFEMIELLRRRARRGGRSGALLPLELQLLGNSLAMVRFGVPCNMTWYLHFVDLVDEGLFKESALRRALRTDAVDVDLQGRVHLQAKGPKSRATWWAYFLGLAVAAVLANTAYLDGRQRHAALIHLLFAADLLLPAVLVCLWYMGPKRWAAEDALRRSGLWPIERDESRPH